MAEIAFDCPHCGQNLEADDNAAGVELACPTCAVHLRVPDRTPPKPSANLRVRPEVAAPVASSTVVALMCQNCGGQLDYSADDDVATCPFCGSAHVVRQPASSVERLRDLESGSLSVSHVTPRIAISDAPGYITSAIEQEPSGYKQPGELRMHTEGVYFAAWRVEATVQCTWQGEYSESRTVTKWRKVTKYSNGRSYQVDEPYNDTEVIWHPASGSHAFETTLFAPAVAGISQHQLDAAASGVARTGDHRGHPASVAGFAVARPSKSQRQAWDESSCDSRVESQAYTECRSCIERLRSVSTVVSSKVFSLIYLPVAVVNYTANGSEYRHFVNLCTGGFSGDLPLDQDTIAQEAKRAGKDQKGLEAARWFVATLGLPAVALFVTLIYDDVNPLQGKAWIGWLVAAFFAIACWRPGAAPWSQFLWSRRAYLLRLLMNPPTHLKDHMHAGSAETVAKIQNKLRELAEDNALEDLDREKTMPFLEHSGRVLLRSVCRSALWRLPVILKAPLPILLAAATAVLVHTDLQQHHGEKTAAAADANATDDSYQPRGSLPSSHPQAISAPVPGVAMQSSSPTRAATKVQNFHPGDHVVLIRDTPLFVGGVSDLEGRQGQTFTVTRAEPNRVFVSLPRRDGTTSEFNVDPAALAPATTLR